MLAHVYDSANQLIRENNEAGGFTYTWEYDAAGNILNKKEYAYTTEKIDGESDLTPTDTVTYGYDEDSAWGDLLTSYDGETIQYDAIGNPESLKGWSFTWKHGRQLASMTNGTTTWTHTYNADGLRTKRTNGSTTYTYVYDNGTLVRMTENNNRLFFSHSPDGTPMAVVYKGEEYYYVTNAQGDVIALLDVTGNLAVEYTYDAWGNLLTTTGPEADTIGKVNPLRYRGYIYDTETGLYYVSSRYYDPEIGRWINADGYVSTGQGVLGNNMFAYCGNNPVNRVDPTGQCWKELWDAFTQTIQQASGYFAVASGVSQVDTPVPGPADVVSGVLLIGGALVCAGIAIYTVITAPAPSISIPKAEEKTEAIVIPREPDSPVIFPVDPNTFNPVGLVKVPRAGTKNGAFISWMDPLTNTEVFRWDENPNYSNGPHYHINGAGHYYPGMIVPEPYATIYFPFR